MKLRKLINLLVAAVFLTVFLPSSLAKATNIMSIDRTTSLIGDIVKVTLTGYSTAGITDGNAFVGLYHYGDIDTANAILKGLVRNMSNFTYDIKMPNELGEYEIRLCAVVNGVLTPLERRGLPVTSSVAKPGDLAVSSDKLLIIDPLTVTVQGFTKGQIDAGAWIGIFHMDDTLQASTTNSMIIRNLQGKTVWTAKTPSELGDYEVRAFTMNTASDKREPVLFGRVPFSVISSTAKDGDLTISKDRFLVNDEITVTIQGLTQGQISNGAWAGLYPADTDISKPTSTRVAIANLQSGNKWVIKKAPTELGNYEIRVFTQNASGDKQAGVLFGKIPFVVESLPAQPGDVTLSTNLFGTVEEFQVKVKGLTIGQIDAGAWMGLYKENDVYSASPLFSKSVFIRNLRDLTTWNIKPGGITPGSYQLRVFTQNTSANNREPVLFEKINFNVVEGINWNNYTLSVVPTSVSIKINQDIKVTAYATHKVTGKKITADDYVKLKIGTASIAYVTGKGYITGTKAGTTKLTVTTKNGKTLQIKGLSVTVKK